MKNLLFVILVLKNVSLAGNFESKINSAIDTLHSIHAMSTVKKLAKKGVSVKQYYKKEHQKKYQQALRELNIDPREIEFIKSKNKTEPQKQKPLQLNAEIGSITPYNYNSRSYTIYDESDLRWMLESSHSKLLQPLYRVLKNNYMRGQLFLSISNLKPDVSIKNTLSNKETICLGYDKDSKFMEGNFLHELGHIKNKDWIIWQYLSEKLALRDRNEEPSLKKINHLVELRADQTYACKNFYNLEVSEYAHAAWYEDFKKDNSHQEDTISHPSPTRRLKEIRALRKLMEAEKEYLGQEWYRREYDRAFYKTLKMPVQTKITKDEIWQICLDSLN